jgi:hypothetical protein
VLTIAKLTIVHRLIDVTKPGWAILEEWSAQARNKREQHGRKFIAITSYIIDRHCPIEELVLAITAHPRTSFPGGALKTAGYTSKNRRVEACSTKTHHGETC